jgi:hypothetical protein
MEKRQITMHDGRYLIFYTFAEEPAPSSTGAKENQAESAQGSEPEAQPEAEEERRV